jgi:penicillin-binding protein 2
MDNNDNRRLHIQILIALAFLVLIGKAAQLQLFDDEIRKQANAVAVEKYTIYPSRGLIYDRNDSLLVTNNPMYDLLVTYNQVDKNMDTLKFCSLLGIDRQEFEERLTKNWRSGRYSKSVPFTFMSKIASDEFLYFQESLYEFPGFEVQFRNAREYPVRTGAHLLGYISEVRTKDIEAEPETYSLGDYIGASGIELAYEKDLRGEKGARYVLKDNRGNVVGDYSGGSEDIDPESGLDIKLGIDIKLQAYAEELLKNKRGAVVAIEPSTGEVLSMVTAPSYDPQDFTIHNDNRGEVHRSLLVDEQKPLFNRSIMAMYPPGSLFKPFVALVAQQEGVLDPDRTLSCNGAYFFRGQRLLGCHGHPTCFNVSNAIQYSCNNYFVTVFRETIDQFGQTTPAAGLDTFNAYLDRFGMGQKLGLDFPGEKAGSYPTSEFFNRRYLEIEKNQAWYSIWLRSLGIGQGELLTTNLQLANMAAILANRGHYYTPHLVKGYRYNVKGVDPKFTTRRETGVSPALFEPIIEGMERVVTAGTARQAYVSDIPICGKTGTAENAGKDHSIFFAFAPKEQPKIAIVVYVENAGFGGSVAAPIASLMIEKYLKGEVRGAQRKYLEKRMLEMDLRETLP